MQAEVFGPFTLLHQLGRGGMAEVFLARAEAEGGFQKLLAIKRLLAPHNADRQLVSMLADEARLSVWLNSPNIVQVLDFGRVGQTYYLALEYVDGCDLCTLLRPKGQSPGRALPLPTALYVMIQVVDALHYAHVRHRDGRHLRIVHRDVSPHNVLLSREGEVKLADFGLARATISSHRSHAGVIRGKFAYMPKEQAHGKEIDHRIDLFAAGATLYESLTGVRPYTATNLVQQIYQLEQPIPPPSARRPELPEEIDDLTMQALSPDAADRYQTAAEMADDLRHALGQISSVQQEARRLAHLIQSALGQRELPPPLPTMSIHDIHLSKETLIGDAVNAARGAAHPAVPGPPPAEQLRSSAKRNSAEARGPMHVLEEVDEESIPTVLRQPQPQNTSDANSRVPTIDENRPASSNPVPELPVGQNMLRVAAGDWPRIRARERATDQRKLYFWVVLAFVLGLICGWALHLLLS
jgi:serine/threonine protein kinase